MIGGLYDPDLMPLAPAISRALANVLGREAYHCVQLAAQYPTSFGHETILRARDLATLAAHYGRLSLVEGLLPGESDPRD